MVDRCTNENTPAYKNYGKRGIGVCDRWKKFKNFKTDMLESYTIQLEKNGEMQTTLDRVDNSKGYSKENCAWANRKTQARNMRVNKMITFNGETYCQNEWAERIGIKPNTLWNRLNVYNWSMEKALTK